MLSEEKLRAEYLINGRRLDCRVFKGQLNANEFILKRQHKYDPFIILIAAYANSDTRVALKDSLLITERESYGVALLGLVIPVFASGGPPSTYFYERK